MAMKRKANGAKAKKKASSKKAFPPRRDSDEFPFGVKEAAKALGVTEQSARVAFRKHDVAKEGSVYAWKTQKAMEAAIKPCKAA